MNTEERIPVLLIGKDASGNHAYKLGYRTVNKDTRSSDMKASRAEIMVRRVEHKVSCKVDQSVLATEIGIND